MFSTCQEPRRLGIFSKRVGTIPAIAGMVAGIGFTGFYIVSCVYLEWQPWLLGINPQGIGVVGMLLNFGVTLALTRFYPPPSDKVRDLIDSIREPEDPGPAVDIDAAPEV